MSKKNLKSNILELEEEEINTTTKKKSSNSKPAFNNLVDENYKNKLNTIHSGNESDEESDSSKLINDNDNNIQPEKLINTQ